MTRLRPKRRIISIIDLPQPIKRLGEKKGNITPRLLRKMTPHESRRRMTVRGQDKPEVWKGIGKDPTHYNQETGGHVIKRCGKQKNKQRESSKT